MGRGKIMFEDVINEDVLDELTNETIETLLAIFEKAGY